MFTTPGTMEVRGIWATATDVWAAAAGPQTQEGAIFRWDGAAWQLSHANTTVGTYKGIWGAAPNDVWVVGDGKEPDGDYAAIHVHWDGAAWTESYSCNPEGSRFAAGGWIADLRMHLGNRRGRRVGRGPVQPGGELHSGRVDRAPLG